jgi:peroxiredoxin
MSGDGIAGDAHSPEWVKWGRRCTTAQTGDVGTTRAAYAGRMNGHCTPLPPGTPAPAFTLPQSSHAAVSLADVRGRRVILVFYPADWEPVSQEQLTLYQDHLARFGQLGAVLLAVSTDQFWCHRAFARAAGLAYPLLADAHPQGAVTRAYGVYDEQAGASARALFVLDEAGIIRWSYTGPAAINPGIGGILTALESMGGPASASGELAMSKENLKRAGGDGGIKMDTTMTAQGDAAGEIWPALPNEEWKDTLATLHMWTQIVGKVKLVLVPYLNEWWQVAFTVTARGLTTSTIPFGRRVFQVDFDFLDHRLDIQVSDGNARSIPLHPRSVADFYREFMGALDALGLGVTITTNPVEVEHTIPFDQDQVHAAYDPVYVTRWWRILLQVDRLLQAYRTPFVGKSSPVLFWWGSFDLSESRFSGRPAPEREWPTRWMARGADQEQASAGFWPGSGKVQAPAFFAYTYPEPPGCRDATIRPNTAFYHPDLSEFILPYDAVRQSPSPDQLILDFFQSTYEVGATLAGWDRAALERPDRLSHRPGERP